MPESLKRFLPNLCFAAGALVGVVFLVFGLISFDNPLLAVFVITIGIAGFSGFSALSVLIEQALRSSSR